MSKLHLTKKQAQEYVRRYRAMNRITREELRRTPVAVKFRQLASLMGLAEHLDRMHGIQRPPENRDIRNRWLKLQRWYS